ncbi:alpha/beta fold hydrolase [Paenibacillus sp.]|uniref:alpha/beta fold hydrolase n=1 Tax=Paenibacillus sp. TaxID=58172 RepID=UPI002D5B565E|nr:alpha/beta fold hydrolase [Paenibacillus sp.]HZG86817.1 alpha/beta fold hydrolase [Paenibacillus sp.]
MPSLDMPLEQLKQYMGRSPKPDDFDAYWAEALQELDATAPEPLIAPSAFQPPNAECFDLTFTGVRGARIYAKYLRPKGVSAPHPAVLQFHGYTGSSGDWSDKLSLVNLGFSVFAMDCRGQGGKSEDVGGVKGNTMRGQFIRGLDSGPKDLLFRHIFLDTAQLARVAMSMPEVDAERIGVQGGSQGGALALVCAALEPRIKRCVSVFPFLSDYKRVWEMDLAKDAYEELRMYFRLFDPRHEREDDIFRTLGYIDVQYLAERIQAEVLMGISLMDNICPPSTQFAAYNRIRSTKSHIIYPDFGHEGLPGFNDDAYLFLSKL